ncbi:Protein Jade-3 [Oxytricha trifallax]|uniref:Protein Jade-3 n=1 Tax=Oxytricha trifallax TaxID=1172189 RepID=A0A073HZA4_9SPIT|nr:Protein Jade-3 [Oxytricha trifallax]
MQKRIQKLNKEFEERHLYQTQRLSSLQIYLNYRERDASLLQVLKQRYFQLYESRNDKEETQVCDICRDNQSEEDNALVFCELCNVGVHQQCYMRDLYPNIPHQDWFCMRCISLIHLNQQSEDISCYLCNKFSGVLIQIEGVTQVIQGKQQIYRDWVHITCVNWIKEIYFEEVKTNNQVDCVGNYSGISGKINGHIPAQNYHMKCSLCNYQMGVCIKCDYRYCNISFHVRCAIDNDIIKNPEQMITDPKDENLKYVYCNKHQPKIIPKKKSESKNDKKKQKILKDQNIKSMIKQNLDTKNKMEMKDVQIGKDGQINIVKINTEEEDEYIIGGDEEEDYLDTNHNSFINNQ